MADQQQPSTVATGTQPQRNISQWSTQQHQTYGDKEGGVTDTALQPPGRVHGSDNTPYVPPHLRGSEGNTPYVPPHLRGIENTSQLSLPPHLRAVLSNTQYTAVPQLNQSIETNDAPIDLGGPAPQTPLHTKASATVPWHISPGTSVSQIKQSPDAYASESSMQANKSSPSIKKDIINHEKKVSLPSPALTSGSQEEAFLAFLNKKTEADAKKRGMSKLAGQATTELTPQPTIPSVSPIHMQTPQVQTPQVQTPQVQTPQVQTPQVQTPQVQTPQVQPPQVQTPQVQTPQMQPAIQASGNPHSIDNTDRFLEFMMSKDKDTQAKGKRYVAISNSPQPEGKDTDGHHKGQNTATTQNTAATYAAPNDLAMGTHNGMATQSNIPVSGAGNYPNQGGLSLPPTNIGAVPSAAAAGHLGHENISTGGLNASYSNNANQQESHAWNNGRPKDAHGIHKAILSEIKIYNPPQLDAPPLTDESLIKTGVWAPRVRSEDSFCGKVSNAGLSVKKENVRALQGKEPGEPLWVDDGWGPLPLNWEPISHMSQFMSKYIKEDWEPFVPRGPVVAVDTNTQEFKQGKRAINGNTFDPQIIQPDCMPDIENSENEQKRLRQTAAMDATILNKRRRKRNRNAEWHAAASEARQQEIEALANAPHPYAPAIPIYLRPATIADAPGIMAIYNHYVNNSIIPEDHNDVSEEDITGVIKGCEIEKLPFIVAIKGNVPTVQPQGYYGKSSKPLPQFETVIGLGWAQTYNYGIGGRRDGRSRATAEIQFYVHHEYTRKGVGRSVLDRLIQSMASTYSGKDGYDWVNPKNDPTYHGHRLWHQLVLHLPVEAKDDTTLPWITPFLAKYWFDEEARLKRISRSTLNRGRAEFLDLVVFTKSISAPQEHHGFL